MNDAEETGGVCDAYDFYPCAGICRIDPESGYCIGCGRPVFPPPLSDPGPVTENSPEQPSSVDPRTNQETA